MKGQQRKKKPINVLLTRHSTNGTAPAVVIDHGGVTLNLTSHCQIAPIPRVSDLSIFEEFDSHLNGVGRISPIPQDGHSHSCRIGTCRQMIFLVGEAVVSSSSMDKDCTDVTTLTVATPAERRHRSRRDWARKAESMEG